MAYSPPRDLRQCRENRDVGGDGDGGCGHHPLDRPVEDGGAVRPEAIDDVTLGKDSGDLAFAQHGKRTDSVFGQHRNGVPNRPIAFDAVDGVALAPENRRDGHGSGLLPVSPTQGLMITWPAAKGKPCPGTTPSHPSWTVPPWPGPANIGNAAGRG